jgi:hypothetical protein
LFFRHFNAGKAAEYTGDACFGAGYEGVEISAFDAEQLLGKAAIIWV